MWLFTRIVIVALIIRTHSFHTINPYWESVLKDYSDDNYYYEDYYDNGDSDVPDFKKENVNLSVSKPDNFNNTFHNSTSVNITEPYTNKDTVLRVTHTELQTNNTHLRVNNTGFLNNNTGFLVNNYKQQNNNGDSQVNIPGLQNGNRDSRVNSTELQNNITDSLLNSSRLQNSNTVSQVNYTELQNDNRNPRVNNTGLQNNNAHSLPNSSGLQNGYAHSLVNYTELQNDNRDSRVNNTGLQNNNAHSLSNSSGLQNGTAVSRVNYTGIQNDSRDSRVNNTGLQNNNAHSLANSSGLQNGNTVSRVNYTGIQNDSRDSRVNNTGLQNNNAHSLANSSGLQNGNAVSRVNYTKLQNDNYESRVNNTGLQNNNTYLQVNNTGSRNDNTESHNNRLHNITDNLQANNSDSQNSNEYSRKNNVTNLEYATTVNWRDEFLYRHKAPKTKGVKKVPLHYVKVRRLCPNGTVCASKCCEFGEQFDLAYKTCRRADHNQNKEFVPPVWDDYKTLDEADVKKINFSPGHKLSCLKSLDEEKRLVTEITKVFRLRSDGKLEVESPLAIGPQLTYDPNKYCIDMFITEENKIKLNAFICHVDNEVMEKYHLLVTGSCYLVTCFFVILRLSLIAWLPELRTLHGVIIIAYLANFIVGYFLTAIKKLFMSEHSISRDLCVALNFMIYFWILSAFFWRNVMCFDMWSTFSGKRVLTRGNIIPRLRFGAYFAYAFGVPAVLTIILAAMEYSKISKLHPLKPKLRLNGCDGISGIGSLIYYFTPLIILFFMNIAMFTSTALKIEATKKQTKILFQSENNVVNALNTDRQRFLLYLKLWAAMLIMEVNWIVKAVVYVFPSIELLAFIVDVSNSVILLMLMIQYFCQKSTWKKVKKKYRQMRGLPQSEQNTATSSNRTMSISSVEGQQAYCNSVTSNYEMHPK